MCAADKNSLDMVKMLLDAKAEVNVQNEVSESDGVCRCAHIAIVYHSLYMSEYSFKKCFNI
jgi:PHP family Zn ribbon phosphoesterase